mgnify:FL=1
MNKLAGMLLCIVAAVVFTASADKPFTADQEFGAPMPSEGQALSLTEAIANLDTSTDQFVKVMGQVTEVCQARGCWMILVDGDTYARITFEDYGFFVPMQTSMQRSVVYGVLSEHVLSGEQADHFAQDAGAQSTLKLEGEVKEYSIVARAVQLENRS